MRDARPREPPERRLAFVWMRMMSTVSRASKRRPPLPPSFFASLIVQKVPHCSRFSLEVRRDPLARRVEVVADGEPPLDALGVPCACCRGFRAEACELAARGVHEGCCDRVVNDFCCCCLQHKCKKYYGDIYVVYALSWYMPVSDSRIWKCYLWWSKPRVGF